VLTQKEWEAVRLPALAEADEELHAETARGLQYLTECTA